MKIKAIVLAIATILTLAQSAEASPECRRASSINKVASELLHIMSIKPSYSSAQVQAMAKAQIGTSILVMQICGGNPDSLENWTKAEQNAAVKDVAKVYKALKY